MEEDTLTSDTQWDALRRAILNSQSVTDRADQPAVSASWSKHNDDETRQDLDEANSAEGKSSLGDRPEALEAIQSPVDFSNLNSPSIALSSSRPSQSSEDVTTRRALSDLRRAARKRAASSQLLRQAIRKARMAFGGQSPPSDTQAIPSQELTSFINNLIASKQTGSTNQTTTDNTHGSHTHHTYATGETGHIDLIGNNDTYAEHDPPENDSGNISEDELAREDTQTREGVVTSPARMSPTTPALAGSKRDARGQIRSPIERTPQDVSAMFRRPQTKSAMGLSQVFHQTQAVSSPPPTGYGEFMFGRPSPDGGPAHRSSPGPESSPVTVRKAPMQRAMTDPKDVYVSMRDSQERRRIREQEIQKQLDDLEDQDELSQDAEERKAELRRQKAAIAAETSKIFSKIDVPSSRRRDRRRKVIEGDPVTPAVQRGKTGRPIVISDDTPKPQLDGNMDLSEDESDAGSRDEYDELSQAVVNIPRSSAKKPHRDHISDQRPTSSPAHASNSARQGYARDTRATRSFHPGSYTHVRSSNAENNLPSQTMQVPYSQPGTIDPTDSLPARPSRPMLVSSMDSRTFVSQSQQDFSLSSTTRQQIHDMPQEISSSIPRPPPFDDEEDDAAGVVRSSPPSSPPLDQSHEVDHERDVQMKLGHANNDADVLGDQASQDVLGGDKAEALEDKPAVSTMDNDQLTASPMHPPKKRPLRRIPDTSPASTTTSARTPTAGRAAATVDTGSSHLRSNSTGAFETARSHNTVEETTASTHSQPDPSPKRVRNLRSIQLGPTPPDLNRDVDAVIDILNEGNDDGFDAAMRRPVDQEPPKKRPRRGASTRKVLHEPSQGENKLPQPSEEGTTKRATAESSKATSTRQTRYSEQEQSRLPEPQASIVASGGLSRATVSSIKPVVSGSLQRNIIGTDTQWTERRPTRFEMQAEAAKVPAAQNPASTVQQRRDTPSLAVDTPAAANPDPRLARRVLARFKDRKISFYPATCLGPGFGEKTVKIRFDDGNLDEEAPEHLVKSFELQPGNQVRIDMAGHRNKTFVVQDVKDKLPLERSARQEFPSTDMHGNTIVVVAPRTAPSKGAPDEGVDQSFEVPIWKIWIQSTNWAQFAGRPFEAPTAASSARLATPINVPSGPNTPSSRSRRRTISSTTQLQPSMKAASFRTEPSAGLFGNMAFAISVSGSEEEKATLARLIQSNGGSILSTNFDALFESETAPTEKSTPASSPAASGELKLASDAKYLGFVALITDGHNRREKYVQALALDIPCLSYRWVHDSVAKEKPQAWDRYLLPAGESTILHGAVRSRTMTRPSYDAGGATLQDTVDRRSKLLDSKSVLLVVGKGKVEERKKAFIFLTYALGARRVERVKDIATAKASLEAPDAPWDFVYVDAGELDDAAARLTGRTPGGKKNKKRNSAATDTNEEKLAVTAQVGKRLVKVVGDEFVVQSLILGALVEEA